MTETLMGLLFAISFMILGGHLALWLTKKARNKCSGS
jgi:hypothetical protein